MKTFKDSDAISLDSSDSFDQIQLRSTEALRYHFITIIFESNWVLVDFAL